MPEQVIPGHGSETLITPTAVVIVVTSILLAWFLPRKYVVWPLILSAVVIPGSQVVVVGGLHFMMYRIIILFVWFRVAASVVAEWGSARVFKLNSLDKLILTWALSAVVTFSILWGSLDAFINRMGLVYNAFGLYFLFRYLIRDWDDVDRTVKVFAAACVILAVCMSIEQSTGRNLFSLFGGVPEYDLVREGRIRAQAGFAHPILAGTFAAVSAPLFFGLLWKGKGSRIVAGTGLIASLIMTVASASSTPVGAYMGGVAALFCWPLRKRMRMVRWGIVLMLIAMQMYMHNPIWHAIGRLNLVGGSASWHREMLVDAFMRHIGEWWLVGTQNNYEWGYDTWDASNQYVNTGVTGGLPTLVLFIAIIVQGFRMVGRARRQYEDGRTNEKGYWALGSSLMGNAVGFFGVSYFDQTIIVWYALLAMVSAVAALNPGAHSATTQVDALSFTPSELEMEVPSSGLGSRSH